jgi:putative phosphoribosyl transferase
MDRSDAGRRLADRLSYLHGQLPLVLGLPRGGVVVAAEVAASLSAPLDVIVVRKLGVPFQPELAMGAIGEGGARVINWTTVRAARVDDGQLDAVESRERAELDRRAERYRSHHVREKLSGRLVIIVDDGIATGSTVRAACQVARAEKATRVVVAAPVGPAGIAVELADVADEVVCLETPPHLMAIGQWYGDFSPTSDDEVVRLLEASDRRQTS